MVSQPAVNGIHHVSLLSADVGRTARFYVDVVGLHITERASDEERSVPDRTWLDGDGALIAVTPSTVGSPGELGIGTIHHVAFTVASLDALLKWKRWLQYNQVLVYGPYDQQAYQDIVFADPDGVLLEIATRGPGWGATQDGQDVYAPPKASTAPYRDEEEIAIQTWPHPITQIESDMVLQGWHHVSTIASSLEQADSFYRAELGLPLVRKTLDSDDPEVEHWYWGLEGGRPGTVITAFPIVHARQESKPIDGRVGVGVIEHFALDVDLDEAALERWGTAVPGRAVESMARSADQPGTVSLCSPDGQVVELVAARQGRAGSGTGDTHHCDAKPAGAAQTEATAVKSSVRDSAPRGESTGERVKETGTEAQV